MVSINSMKSYHPFMSLRLSTTGVELHELNGKMTVLVKGLEDVFIKIEVEELEREQLTH
jgi:hypothetical protein